MLPAALQDPTILMEVSEATWRKVFDAAGEMDRFSGKTFRHADIPASFEDQPPGTELFNALERIHELGTEDGRTHIEQIALDHGVTLPIPPDSMAAREFVAHLWIAGRTDPALDQLLVTAQLTQRRSDNTRTYREFVGAGSAPTTSIDKETLKSTISDWCRANNKADIISITTIEYKGEWYGHILRGDPPKRVPEVRDKRVGVLQYQPLAADLLRYDPKTGRVGIATRSPTLLNAYRNTLGTLLVGDDQFFAGENVCSLRPLQFKENALFTEHRVIGINRVDVVNLLWRGADRDKVWVSGRDCFHVLRSLGAKLIEGDLIEARLKVYLSSGGRPADVTLKVPNIIQIRATEDSLVERLLDATGLRGSFDDEGTPKNFWGEYPWAMKEAEWRRRLGNDFDRMFKGGLLRSVTLDTVAHPDHPHAGRPLDVEDVGSGVAIGVSSNPAIGVRTLTTSDTEGYQLHLPSVAQEVKTSLGLEGACMEIIDNSGVWSLGVRNFGPNMTVAAFLVTREPGVATAALIKEASRARGAIPLALYPGCCQPIEGVNSASCRLPQGPHGSLLEESVRSLQWQGLIPPTIWSSADLIIDSVRGLVFYQGLQISAVQPGTHPFKFATMVARANGQTVATGAINNHLSPDRPDNDAAKTAKRDFLKAIKAAHEKAGRSQPTEPFGSSRGNYWLKVTALVHA